MATTILTQLVLAGVVFFGLLNLTGLLTWVERKQSAVIQDRIGANRASIFGLRLLGLFHPLADVIKMITKEDFVPPQGYRLLHALAPFLSVFFALVAFAAIPFGNTLQLGVPALERQMLRSMAGLKRGLLRRSYPSLPEAPD